MLAWRNDGLLRVEAGIAGWMASGGPFKGQPCAVHNPPSHGVCHAILETKEQARPESRQTGEYCMTGVLVRGVTG
jgi:hypothetical protein